MTQRPKMPSKAKANANHDDAKSETLSVKDSHRNGHGSNHKETQSSTKMRRVASTTGSQLRDTSSVNGTSLAAGASATTVANQAAPAPGLQWPTFDRDFLHDYRREHRLDTPTAFSNPYHLCVLSRPGIGLRSPTMARKQDYRRQTKDDLTKVVRKHFNGVGVQENDVIANFLHKVRNPGISRVKRNKAAPHSIPLP